MGDGYNLAAGTTAITGFDVYPVNVSGVNYTGLKINIFVWGSVNTSGTVNATTPAFGNLLASYSLTSSGAFKEAQVAHRQVDQCDVISGITSRGCAPLFGPSTPA